MLRAGGESRHLAAHIRLPGQAFEVTLPGVEGFALQGGGAQVVKHETHARATACEFRAGGELVRAHAKVKGQLVPFEELHAFDELRPETERRVFVAL